jgi:oligo-1,6-glucosidase/alpha-glucosidase
VNEPSTWWQKTVVYQIYPRSFKDSTGAGIGDLRGIISKLDYLVELGVETVWLNPHFPSPQADHGYDVADFYNVDPGYGTMDDFDSMLSGMHERGLKLLLDLVNHTSVEHPWFKESASSRDNPKADWFIWADGKKPGGKKPPNNWHNVFGGSAWKYFPARDQWVYFDMIPDMCALNYWNPEAKNAMLDIMRFWLDKGVDGFRFDVFHGTYKDKNLHDDTRAKQVLPSDESTASMFWAHKWEWNQPASFEYAREVRRLVDGYEPARMLVGEVFGPLETIAKYCGPENDGLNTIFVFAFTASAFTATSYTRVLSRIERVLPPPCIPSYTLSNHDRMRFITRIGDDVRKAKLAATLELTLRCIPFIYYGEEIGMPNTRFGLRTSQDPTGRHFWWMPISQSKRLGFSLTRDGARTPMQWNAEVNAGFSPGPEAKPWLKISKTYQTINVTAERDDADSLLNCYRRLIAVRKENIALQEGTFEPMPLPHLENKCFAYRRVHADQELHVFLNFTNNRLKVPISLNRHAALFSTQGTKDGGDVGSTEDDDCLEPWEGIIF